MVFLNGVRSHEGTGILDFLGSEGALLVGRVSKEEEEEAEEEDEERESKFLKLTMRMRRWTMYENTSARTEYPNMGMAAKEDMLVVVVVVRTGCAAARVLRERVEREKVVKVIKKTRRYRETGEE